MVVSTQAPAARARRRDFAAGAGAGKSSSIGNGGIPVGRWAMSTVIATIVCRPHEANL